MTYRVVISEDAKTEMWNIKNYISDELHSPESALNLMREIRK
jgi:hypothetical protein